MPVVAEGSRAPGRRRPAAWAALGALALAAALGAGCTSEPANPTGVGLTGDQQFDTLLAPLTADSIDAWGRLTVVDPAVPFTQRQVLYLGKQGSERSSILTRYNFGTPIDTLPAGLSFTADNIRSVRLRLFQLSYYKQPKLYQVYTLAAPLDSTAYLGAALPPEPATAQLIASQFSSSGADVEIDLKHIPLFLSWYQQGIPNGLMITEGDTTAGVSSPGMAGYGSSEMRFAASTIAPDLAAGTVVGPIIKVEFLNPDVTIRWQAIINVSTFASLLPLPATPADGAVLRTDLRSYPFLAFALDRLPPNAFINRAVLTVTNDADTLQSYGPPCGIVCGEMHPPALPHGGSIDSTVTVDSLAARVRIASGQTGLSPLTERRMEFDVTLSLQRQINGVYGTPLRFLLLADELFTGGYHISGPAPDFYLRRFHFLGTSAPDPLDRPHLAIHYTLKGGGGGKAR